MTAHVTIAQAKPGFAAGIGYLRRRTEGARHCLVLLHGIGSNAGSFEPLINALPDTLDVIAWNAPGYGNSTPLTTAAPAPRDYARALAGLLDALGLRKIALAGHSLGALFAGSFAALYPERVAGLALLSPALGYRVPPDGVLPPAVQARIDEIEALGPSDFAAKRAAKLVHEPKRKPALVAAVQAAMAAADPAGYAQAVRALGAGDLIAAAAAIKAPTWVAVGSEDSVTPPANARTLYAALPHAVALREIAGAGHALPQEAPAAVAELLTQVAEGANV